MNRHIHGNIHLPILKNEQRPRNLLVQRIKTKQLSLKEETSGADLELQPESVVLVGYEVVQSAEQVVDPPRQIQRGGELSASDDVVDMEKSEGAAERLSVPEVWYRPGLEN